MQQEEKESSDFDLRAYWRTVVDFRWLIVLVTVIVGAATIVWTLSLPRVYESSTTIEYDPRPATPLGAEVDGSDGLGGYWNVREYYATQNRRLTSRSLAESVVRELDLHHDPTYYDPDGTRRSGDLPEIYEVADMLRSRISVDLVRDTRIVRLSVRDRSPERARALADAYADIYVNGTQSERSDLTEQAFRQLSTQLDALREQLEASELALHEFKREHNILSVSMEDRQNLVAGEIQALSTALTEARQRRIEARARLRRLREAAAVEDESAEQPIFDDRSGLGAIREALRAKLAQQRRASARYGANHPEMRALANEITELRAQIRTETRNIVQSAAADLREATSIEGGLREALDSAHEAGLELNLREIEFRRLYREQENNSKAYQLVLDRTTETGLTQSYRPTYAEVVDHALVPDFPVAPNRTANAIGGTVAGLFLGILLAFGIRFLDRRLRTPEMLESLGATLLGVIPEVGEPESELARRRRKRGRRRDEKHPIVVHDQPQSAAAECCRTIRTNLTFMSAADGIAASRCLVVTGSLPQEGKTTVSTNVAASFAQSGKRVLLVDADLRKPKVHKALGLSRDVGLTSYFLGESSLRQMIQPTRIEGLDAVASGPVPPNPAELLHSPALKKLIEEARESYDVIVFDTPPLGAVTDAAIIAPQVDGVIVVARAKETTRDAFASSLRQLRDVNARVLGSVFNAFNLTGDGYYGRGYYYRRYGEYYADQDETEATETAEAAE